jgi:hypothetical protein
VPVELLLAVITSGPALVLTSKLIKAGIERALDRHRAAGRVEAVRAALEGKPDGSQQEKDGVSPALAMILDTQLQELSDLPAAADVGAATYHSKGEPYD